MGIGVDVRRFCGLRCRAVLFTRVGGGEAGTVARDLEENPQDRAADRARNNEADDAPDHAAGATAV